MLRKYRLIAKYAVEVEIETDLTGEELFNHYSGIVESEETKKKACLVHADRLFICKCGSGYSRSAPKFCSNCGGKHVFDKVDKESERDDS